MKILHARTLALLAVVTLSACTEDGPRAGDDTSNAAEAVTALSPPLTVRATDDSCVLGGESIPAGTAELAIANAGQQVTEVYVRREDGTVVAEREDIRAGEDERLTVELPAGSYTVSCEPAEGEPVTAALTATGGAATGPADPRLEQAVTAYRQYVTEQVEATVAESRLFVAAIKAGDLAQAKTRYAPSRIGWESIEPVAESFGDLDPKVDLREADLAAGDTWTGWHRLEKGLFAQGSTEDLAPVGDRLLADLAQLQSRIPTAEITAVSMANGSKELLDEVATGKITGEEEAFSHTDLVDFDANVAGALKAYELLEPVVVERKPMLATTLDREFADVRAALAPYRTATGFVDYSTVTEPRRRALAQAVDALAEPLSQLAAVVADR